MYASIADQRARGRAGSSIRVAHFVPLYRNGEQARMGIQARIGSKL